MRNVATILLPVRQPAIRMTAPHPIDLLIRADYLYPMTEGDPIIAPGEVAIRGDRIVHAGPPQPPGHWQAAQVMDQPGRAVLPGLINTHTHAASLVFRSQTDDHDVGRALYGVAFPTERDMIDEDWRLLARLGCCDLLRSGVTTFNDIWYAPEGLAEAVRDAGLRAQIAGNGDNGELIAEDPELNS